MAKKIPSGLNTDLYKEYKRLADRADKRLLRLERLSQSQSDYSGVLSYAYRKAKEAIYYWSGELDKPRFARDTPTSNRELKKKIKDIEAFLNMPTSTKSGIDKIYKKRAESLNKRFDTDFTWQEWSKFAIRGFFDKQDKIHYRELIKVASQQKKSEKMIKAHDKLKKSGNKNMATTAKEIMKEFKLSRDDLNLLQKTTNTIFEEDEGIVLKQAKKYMKASGLNYNSMFT